MLRPASSDAAAVWGRRDAAAVWGRRCCRHRRRIHTGGAAPEPRHVPNIPGAASDPKQVANLPRAAWRTGRPTAAPHRTRVGPLYGNNHAVYATLQRTPTAIPRLVALNSELHQALVSMPHTRRGLRFNPWSLLLELFDDTRLALASTQYRSKILVAAGHLGWVTPGNVMSQRPLIARYLLTSRCLEVDGRYLHPGIPGTVVPEDVAAREHAAVDLSPAQLTMLCQVQWPRFIAAKYRHAMPHTGSVGASRAWLCAHLSMIENTADYVKQRAVFNRRLGVADQIKRLIRRSYEHAPGLALNAIMGWNGDLSEILTPAARHHICARYFADMDAARNAVAQAWQMYDRLVYRNPHVAVPRCLDWDTPRPTGRFRCEQDAEGSPASMLFRSLRSFDSWAEATRSLEVLYRAWDAGTPPLSSDQNLTERYLALRPSKSPFRTQSL
ncbi:hypothetical protein GGI15_004581 [Coemansia interrupta]|uniref:Uncharacterized protein n=1 Tax=Coemansia interrupta TaxID=1126814 RepID=A0A9W8LF32_9FUNG|nr:hypothetical protein GGI15_004581 [Coemansia interrupta]